MVPRNLKHLHSAAHNSFPSSYGIVTCSLATEPVVLDPTKRLRIECVAAAEHDGLDRAVRWRGVFAQQRSIVLELSLEEQDRLVILLHAAPHGGVVEDVADYLLRQRLVISWVRRINQDDAFDVEPCCCELTGCLESYDAAKRPACCQG